MVDDLGTSCCLQNSSCDLWLTTRIANILVSCALFCLFNQWGQFMLVQVCKNWLLSFCGSDGGWEARKVLVVRFFFVTFSTTFPGAFISWQFMIIYAQRNLFHRLRLFDSLLHLPSQYALLFWSGSFAQMIQGSRFKRIRFTCYDLQITISISTRTLR